MSVLRVFMLTMAGLFACASDAAAQWMYDRGEDDPFAGGAQHMAMALSSLGEMVGFRCTKLEDLALLYVSIEKPDPESMRIVLAMPVKIMVIVDDEPKREYSGDVDVTPDGSRYRFTTVDKDLADLADLAAGAKRRFAIAVEMMGKRLYSTAVGVQGSRLAISKLTSGCKLP